jgi:hypothetical protein
LLLRSAAIGIAMVIPSFMYNNEDE